MAARMDAVIHIRQFAWPDYDGVTDVWKSAGRSGSALA
jgi:hypothetical protein